MRWDAGIGKRYRDFGDGKCRLADGAGVTRHAVAALTGGDPDRAPGNARADTKGTTQMRTHSRARRLLGRSLAAAAAAAALCTTAAGQAQAVEVFILLKAHHSGKVVDVNNNTTAQDQPGSIIQFQPTGGQNQQWKKINLAGTALPGRTNDFLLRNRKTGLCLDTLSSAAGALVQHTCDLNGGRLSQRWNTRIQAEIFSPAGGFRHVYNRQSGLAMDVAGASQANGAQIVQFPEHGSPTNQHFEQPFGGAA